MILLMFSVFLKTIFLVPDYQWFHSKIKHILKTELCTILDRYVGTQLPTAKHKSSDQFVDYYFFCSEEVKLSQFSIEWINNDKFSLTRFLFQFFAWGSSLNHVDQFLAIFDPPSPLVEWHGLLNDPPNNYVDFWKAPPPLRTFFSPSLSTAYLHSL